jgi:hypothetical protein
MKLEYYREIFGKYSNIKYHENPFSGSRVALYGLTDVTKLIVGFSQFYVPNNCYIVLVLVVIILRI